MKMNGFRNVWGERVSNGWFLREPSFWLSFTLYFRNRRTLWWRSAIAQLCNISLINETWISNYNKEHVFWAVFSIFFCISSCLNGKKMPRLITKCCALSALIINHTNELHDLKTIYICLAKPKCFCHDFSFGSINPTRFQSGQRSSRRGERKPWPERLWITFLYIVR